MAGIDFFPTGKETTIKIINLEVVTENKEFFKELLNEIVLAQPTAQFYFERIGETKNILGSAVDDIHYYSFTAKHAVEVLKQSGKDATLWETLDPEMEVTLIDSACEVIDEPPIDPFIKRRRREISMLLDPVFGAGSGNYCPECHGPCGNSNHTGRKW